MSYQTLWDYLTLLKYFFLHIVLAKKSAQFYYTLSPLYSYTYL